VTEGGEYWAEVGGTMAGVDEQRDAGCAPGQVSRRRQWQPRVREGNTERSLATGSSSRHTQDRDETALILWLARWVRRRARVCELAARPHRRRRASGHFVCLDELQARVEERAARPHSSQQAAASGHFVCLADDLKL
jgi:hypothetical protein